MEELHRFCSRKIALKMQIFQVFLPLKEPLVAPLSETCALISRTNVAEKGMTNRNLSETLRLLWSHSSVLALKKSLRNAKFFSLKRKLLATLI